MLTNNFSNNNVFFKDNREKETFVEFIGKLCQFKKLNLQGLKHWHINHVLEFGGTEFDLLSIGEILINVELKSQFPKGGISAVKEQLAKSKHYLNHINDECFFFTYIKGEGFYQYQNENIEKVNLDALVEKINLQKSSKQEIKDLFRPSEFLVSPLNDWKKFLNRKYYLTQQQEEIKRKIVKSKEKFHAITGNPGTGKTLLGYDIFLELTNNETGILYFSGKLNQGLKNIEKKCANIKIVNHKQLSGSLESKKHKVILVDETQRCYIEDLRKIVEYCKENEAKLIFLYDSKQWVTSQSESQKNVNLIVKEAAGNEYKLTDKIRTNKNLSDFVKKYLIRASHNQKTIKAFQ